MTRFYAKRLFWVGCLVAILQQISVGLSTYWMGIAGRSLALATYAVLPPIVKAFVALLCAYAFGGISNFLTTRLGHQLWVEYCHTFFTQLKGQLQFATEKNRKTLQTWIGSEALSTLQEATNFLFDILSIYGNTFFNLVAVWFIVGTEWVLILCAMLLTAALLIQYNKRRIERFANQLQQEKNKAILGMCLLWDSSLFGNSAVQATQEKVAYTTCSHFGVTKERYQLLELIITLTPIFMTIPAILLYLAVTAPTSIAEWGGLVVTLPRVIQMLQQASALTAAASQFVLMKEKLDNLSAVRSHLETVEPEQQIQYEKITILSQSDPATPIAVRDLLKQIPHLKNGRYTLKGRNGAGKTALLKLLKGTLPEALMIGPGSELHVVEPQGSTGERQRNLLDRLVCGTDRCFLLDEWDANFDEKTRLIYDNTLTHLAQRNLIIESRHASGSF